MKNLTSLNLSLDVGTKSFVVRFIIFHNFESSRSNWRDDSILYVVLGWFMVGIFAIKPLVRSKKNRKYTRDD
jgi:hypothetical protein